MEAENSASKIANRELQKQLNAERKSRDAAEEENKKTRDELNNLKTQLKEAHEVFLFFFFRKNCFYQK